MKTAAQVVARLQNHFSHYPDCQWLRMERDEIDILIARLLELEPSADPDGDDQRKAKQLRSEMEWFRKMLDEWGYRETQVSVENPYCYRVESIPPKRSLKQTVWIYWQGNQITAQPKPPG